MKLSELLDNPDLNLELASGRLPIVVPDVRWVAATELADPTPFLDGGELVLTTGLALAETGADIYVKRLANTGVAAIGFGIGLSHVEIPVTLLAAAERHDLPVLAVPYETPFIAISRAVAEQVIAERYTAEVRAVEVHEHLAGVLLAGGGVEGLTESVADLVEAPCALIDFHGRVLADTGNTTWSLEEILGHRTETDSWLLEDGFGFPILLEGEVTAMLCTRSQAKDEGLFRSAVTMIGLELARRAAVLTGRRLLLGQVLEDVVRGTITDEEAARRLDQFGLAGSSRFSAVVGAIPGGEGRLQNMTWAVQTLVARRGDPIDTALVEGRLVLIVQGGGSIEDVSKLTFERLHRIAPEASVGIGRTYDGIGGLRRSLLEALSAAGRGPGVHDASALSLAGSLGLDRSGQAIARAMLAPLVDHDRATGSDLIRTLVAYLRHDCRSAPTAEYLALHRNGLAYRLSRIEDLTGRDLSRLEDRVELVLAARTSGRM